MKRDEDQPAERYSTLDAYESAYLVLQGIRPEFIAKGPKVVFSFPHNDAVQQALSAYRDGAVIEAIRFAYAVKALKGRIHDIRGGAR